MSKFTIPLLRGIANEAARDGKAAITKAKNELKQAEKAAVYLERLNEDMAASTGSEVEARTDMVRDAVRDLYAGLMKTFVSLSHFVSVPFSCGRILDEEDYLPAHMELEKTIEGIEVYPGQDRIMIRTPLLPNVRNLSIMLTSSYGGTKFIMTSTKAYCYEVGRALDQSEAMRSIDRTRYTSKTIQYLFVFSDERNEVDNDNRDTTQMTNTICERVYGGDAPTRCRLVLDAVKTESLPEGTYIAVLPENIPALDTEDIIHFWEKAIQK